MQSRSFAAVAEREILFRERLADQKSIEAAFQVTNVGHVTGEVPTGCGKDTCLTNLAPQLISDAMLMRQCDQIKGTRYPATFRKPDVEKIAPLADDRTLRVFPAAQGFVEHDRDAEF